MTTRGAPDPSGMTGRTVSHFRVLDTLGAGGMGVVYRGEDLRLQRVVALKFMLPGYVVDDRATARFLREARAVAALDHPNICTIHEVGESEEGHLFLAMSYYTGETLKERLTTRGALAMEETLAVASQIARGLACAHRTDIVHRDLKPANVMITGEGTVKILDFGLAKSWDQTVTASGAILGTVAYMAPEQLAGDHVDARSDLWSLGAMLFEMLTGQRPSRSQDAATQLVRRLEKIAPSVSQRDLGALQQLVQRLLRDDPAERYQTADDLLVDLEALRTRMAAGVDAHPRTHRMPRARIALGSVAALVLLASVLGVLRWRATRAGDGVPVGAAESPTATRSLAVLPLKNYSAPDQEYFADGMTEELTTTLTKIEALKVIAHQSVAQFKRSVRPVPEIARLLDVRYVVDGSVTQDDKRVRITANLIDATRNAPVWGESFERERRDVMALQREVAIAIARAIEVALTPQDRVRLASTRAVDPRAFELYIKGTQARYDANFSGDFTTATKYLTSAVAADSGYAPAYAGLALIHVNVGDEVRARRFDEKALQLDATLAEGQMSLGLIRQFYDWDWSGSEKAYRDALALNPGYAEAHHELSMVLMRRVRFDEALREAQRALYLAPMSARFLDGLGQVQVYSGKYDETLATANRLLAIDSINPGAFALKGRAFEERRRYDDAARAWTTCIRLSPNGCPRARAQLGYIDGVTGHRAEAIQIADTLKSILRATRDRGPAALLAVDVATIYAGLGQRNDALDWLERAAQGQTQMLNVGIDPTFRSLRGEPRFKALLERIGLRS